MTVELIALIVSSSFVYAAPLIFTSLGGVFSESSGVVNVGLEGIMVIGALSSVVFNLTFLPVFGPQWTPWLALLAGGLAGLLFSVIHAVATVHLRADHIISGTVLNLIAIPLAVFLVRAFFGGKGETPSIQKSFGYTDIPLLENIPVLGRIFFKATSLPAYFGMIVALVAWFVLYKTPFGLRIRSVGEHPHAAETLGVNVYKMKYAGVLLSGFLGGMGGAVLANSITLNFSQSTIAGQGFMSMAAMIFGKYNPLGALGAGLFFGFAQSLAVIGSQIPYISSIPPVYLQIAPYLITIIVLIGFVGQSRGPAANGITYVKTK